MTVDDVFVSVLGQYQSDERYVVDDQATVYDRTSLVRE